jgi:hypothetical protein
LKSTGGGDMPAAGSKDLDKLRLQIRPETHRDFCENSSGCDFRLAPTKRIIFLMRRALSDRARRCRRKLL